MTNVSDDELPRGAGGAAAVDAIPAATVIALREAPLEVLMLHRHATSSFVPNAWVFPGGVVEPDDERGVVLDTMRIAALRELFEETGLWLGKHLMNAEPKRKLLLSGQMYFSTILGEAPVTLTDLVWTSRWITPLGMPKRFDTYFFLARVPDGAIATAQESEAAELLWITPKEALRRHAEGTFPMVFPTIRNLEAIAEYTTINSLLEARRNAEIPTTEPVLVVEDNEKKIVLP